MGQYITPASVNISLYFNVVEDSGGVIPGEPKTGLVFGDITQASFVRERAVAVSITPITLASADAGYADGGFIQVDATKQPGVYRFDPPDAAFASPDVNSVVFKLVFAAAKNAIAEPLLVDLEARQIGSLGGGASVDVAVAVWDKSAANHGQTKTMGALLNGGKVGVIQASPAPTTTQFKWDGPGTKVNQYKGQMVLFAASGGGAADGEARMITNYTSDKIFTVDPPLTAAPGALDDVFVVAAFNPLLLSLGAELPQAAPAASPTQRELLMLLNMLVRNKIVTSASEQKVEDDGGTVAFKHPLSFDAPTKTTTRDEMISGP